MGGKTSFVCFPMLVEVRNEGGSLGGAAVVGRRRTITRKFQKEKSHTSLSYRR